MPSNRPALDPIAFAANEVDRLKDPFMQVPRSLHSFHCSSSSIRSVNGVFALHSMPPPADEIPLIVKQTKPFDRLCKNRDRFRESFQACAIKKISSQVGTNKSIRNFWMHSIIPQKRIGSLEGLAQRNVRWT